jgi:6-phosphogluconolactonase
VTNRGEDSIVVYSIDARTGELAFKQRVPSGGKVPRYFSFDPSGKWLIVSNQDGGTVVVFAVDAKSGELTRKSEVALPRPMAIAF